LSSSSGLPKTSGLAIFCSPFENHPDAANNNNIVLYGSSLNLEAIKDMKNWVISSEEDEQYGKDGLNPDTCFRKSKVNGMGQFGWLPEVPHNTWGDYDYHYTFEHYLFLKLPKSLKQGKKYTIQAKPLTKSNSEYSEFAYDIFNSQSEAIHTNLLGYSPDSKIHAADLYIWMGDGGARDFSSFEGNNVYLYDINSQKSHQIGEVAFWKQGGIEFNEGGNGFDPIKSKVWNIDFSGFNKPGKYRLVVEGIGCSQDFEISGDIFFEPFRVSTLGFFYMRIGEDSAGISPVPRRPLWIPGKEPVNCKIIVTDMDPFHPDWQKESGDKWDKPEFFAKYIKKGSPENLEAVGGHSDALDWDRHLGHVAISYDMLLPFLLSDGKIDDDDLGIAESGNGIPDIIDEARNEVDFWLKLRYNGGYSHGLTNPDKNHVLFQADNTALAAWANALNAAMLGDCFRVAGKSSLMNEYRDSALVAYDYASALEDQQLDVKYGIGEDMMRGRDFKMTAAAYLFNLTGDKKFEEVIKQESMVDSDTAQINKRDHWNQIWAVAAYHKTPHKRGYPELYENMKKSIIFQAKKMEADWTKKRASRRAHANNNGYYLMLTNVTRTILAHSMTDNQEEKDFFKNALTFEFDWSMGRNPANMILMTTASTPLADKRSVQSCYTTGQDDGVPGVHPGHTPYFNIHDWAPSMIMGTPSNLYKRSYPPKFEDWPRAEVFFNTRYVWAHAEFTPQQTMRGKMALYGYLYSLGE